MLEDKLLQWENTYSIDGTTYPISREGHTVAYSNYLKSIILFGGMNSTRNNDLFIYNLKNKNWQKFETTGKIPQKRCYQKGFVDNEYFFIYSGQGDKNRSLNDIYVLDLKNKKWYKIENENNSCPKSRVQTGLVFDKINKCFFIFGGLNLPSNEFFNDIWKFDYSKINLKNDKIKGKWEEIITNGEKPMKRKGHIFLKYENKFFIFGGIGIDRKKKTNEIFTLNYKNKKWEKIGGLKIDISSRYNFDYAKISENKIFIYGGIENKTRNILKDLILWDLKTLNFSYPFVSGKSPGPTNGHGMCSIFYKEELFIFLIGGVNNIIKGMELYFLKFYDKNDNYEWSRKNKKTNFEAEVEQKGYDYLFEISKKSNEIKDLILIEKQKQVSLKKNFDIVEKEYFDFEKTYKEIYFEKKNKEESLNEENNSNLKKIEILMDLIKKEEMKEEINKEKVNLLQNNFKKIFKYTKILDRSVSTIFTNKLINKNNKLKNLSELLKENKVKIKMNKERFQNYLISVPGFYKEFSVNDDNISEQIYDLEKIIENENNIFKEFNK